MYTIFFILLITITCVVVNINRKEQNKTEEKKWLYVRGYSKNGNFLKTAIRKYPMNGVMHCIEFAAWMEKLRNWKKITR